MQRVEIIEIFQRVTRYFAQIEICDLRTQYPIGLQAGEQHLVTPAVVQQTSQLQRLSFRAAFVEAVYKLENAWLHLNFCRGLMRISILPVPKLEH